MNPVYPPFATHVTYQAGIPSGWKRFIGWDTRDPRIHQDLTPTAAVNRISSKPSKFGFLYKWKLKKVKVTPKPVQHDAGYFLTSDGYVITNGPPPPAYVQAPGPLPRTVTPKKKKTTPSNPTASPEISPRKSKRRSTNQYQHVPQSSSHTPATPTPSPTHLHRSSSTKKTPHHHQDSGPSAPKHKKKVRWADNETRKRSHSESHHQHYHHKHTQKAPHHPIYDHGLAAYDPQYPTWQQYRQAIQPPQQLPAQPSHSHSYSYPPDAQQLEHRYVIPPQRRKSVPYHLIPPLVIPEQRH